LQLSQRKRCLGDTLLKFVRGPWLLQVYYADDLTWVEKAFIPTARFRTAAVSTGGLAFVIGGADLCIDMTFCPELDVNEVFLDVDHPHVYIYLKNEVYNDTANTTTYPF
jgi:hypothetical protein